MAINRTAIIGTNNTTPGVATAGSTLSADTTGYSVKTVTNSTAGSPGTITVAGHGLPTTASTVVFSAKSGLSESPSITLDTSIYYVKQIDANTLSVYSDYNMTNAITIGANGGTATFRTFSGLLVKYGAGSPSTQSAIKVLTAGGATVFEVMHDGHAAGYNIKVGAVSNVFLPMTNLNGQQNPPCIEMANGSSAGLRIWGGTGAPSASTVGSARIGDWYLRRDTPSTANQRLYVCTVAGTPGTWSGIA